MRTHDRLPENPGVFQIRDEMCIPGSERVNVSTANERDELQSGLLHERNGLDETDGQQLFSEIVLMKNTSPGNAKRCDVSCVVVVSGLRKSLTSLCNQLLFRTNDRCQGETSLSVRTPVLVLLSSPVVKLQTYFAKGMQVKRIELAVYLRWTAVKIAVLKEIVFRNTLCRLERSGDKCYFKIQIMYTLPSKTSTAFNFIECSVSYDFVLKVQIVSNFIVMTHHSIFYYAPIHKHFLASPHSLSKQLNHLHYEMNSTKIYFILCFSVKCVINLIILIRLLKILKSYMHLWKSNTDTASILDLLFDAFCMKPSHNTQNEHDAIKQYKDTCFPPKESLRRERGMYKWAENRWKSKTCMKTSTKVSVQLISNWSNYLDRSKIDPKWNADSRNHVQQIAYPRGLWTLQAIYHVWPVSRFFPDLLSTSNFNDMAFLGYRLATLSALPSSVPVSRVKLADAGFYFRGEGDEVQCYRCQGRYSGWRAGDNPMDVHRRISPGCPHLAEMDRESLEIGSRDFVGHSQSVPNGHVAMPNVSDHAEDGEQGPVVQEPTSSRGASVSDTRAVDAVSNQSAAASLAATSTMMFPRPSLDLGGAVYPMYQDMSSRRRSYPAWNESRAPPLEQMVLSGFYYAGYADCVRCFYCGVGLKSWEVTDDVWAEHIRWRPNCGYLLAVKGESYIRQVLDHIRRESQGMFHESPPRCRERQDADSRSSIPGGHSSLERSRGQHLPPANAMSANPTPMHSTTATTIGGSHSPRSTNQSSTAHVSTLETTSQPATVPNASLSIATVTTPDTRNGSGSEYAGILSTSASQLHSNGQVDSSHVAVSGGPGTRGPGISVVHSDTEPEIRARERHEHLLRENQDMTRRLQCKICHHNNINTIFLPCGHLVTCEICAQTTTICPVCHDTIQGTAAVHMN